MNVKDLFKQAVDAKINGDNKKFTETMKQVMASKVSKMVSEMSYDSSFAEDDERGGDVYVHVGEYEYNGELVDLGIDLNIANYQAATQGNYSPQASDPSEFHGDDEELEWQIVSANLVYEDGRQETLRGEEANNLDFTDEQVEKIDASALEQLKFQRENDQDFDDRDFD